jgi:hypothetical protein
LAFSSLIGITNTAFTILVVVLYVAYVLRHKTLDELSRRLLFSGFFFAIHELTYFLGNPFVYEMTKMLFFLVLFYSLHFVVTENMALRTELDEQKVRNTKLKELTEEISESWLEEKKELI